MAFMVEVQNVKSSHILEYWSLQVAMKCLCWSRKHGYQMPTIVGSISVSLDLFQCHEQPHKCLTYFSGNRSKNMRSLSVQAAYMVDSMTKFSFLNLCQKKCMDPHVMKLNPDKALIVAGAVRCRLYQNQSTGTSWGFLWIRGIAIFKNSAISGFLGFCPC